MLMNAFSQNKAMDTYNLLDLQKQIEGFINNEVLITSQNSTFIFLGIRFIEAFIIVICVLLAVAFFTVVERKYFSYIQRRAGPIKVGPFGQGQAFADALKLLVKKTIYPQNINGLIFIGGPLLTFTFSFGSWAFIPFNEGAVFLETPFSLLYIQAFSALSTYGIILGGWGSNSKYAFLGAMRALSQMIAYEVSLGIIFLSLCATAGNFSLTGIVLAQTHTWFVFMHFPICILFFISAIAETNRHPFDFAEAESELVSGYNTEYGGILFVLYFLAEYSNIILMSYLTAILFFGGWLMPFLPLSVIQTYGSFFLALKAFFFMSLFVFVRAMYPRFRYDRLMQYCWKYILPMALGWFVFTLCCLGFFELSPPAGGFVSMPEDLPALNIIKASIWPFVEKPFLFNFDLTFNFSLAFLGANLLLASFVTVTSNVSIVCLLSLVFAFINLAGIFFLLDLEFLGLFIIIIYIGAISVLFLFSVLLFNLKEVAHTKTNRLVIKDLTLYFIMFLGSLMFLINADLINTDLTLTDPRSAWYALTQPYDNIHPSISDKNFGVLIDTVKDSASLLDNLYDNEEKIINDTELSELGTRLYNESPLYVLSLGVLLLAAMIIVVSLINTVRSDITQSQSEHKQMSRQPVITKYKNDFQTKDKKI